LHTETKTPYQVFSTEGFNFANENELSGHEDVKDEQSGDEEDE